VERITSPFRAKEYSAVVRCLPSHSEACSRNFAVVTVQGLETKHVQFTIVNRSGSHMTVFNCCFELTTMCADARDRKFAAEAWLDVSRSRGALMHAIVTADVVFVRMVYLLGQKGVCRCNLHCSGTWRHQSPCILSCLVCSVISTGSGSGSGSPCNGKDGLQNK